MNSEELELSLRTEFESYLKDVFAEMRQEISQLQEHLNEQLDRQKTELSSVFGDALNKFGNERELDEGFKDTVIEHLRLSKDEGARITATAIAEAEEMEKSNQIAASAVAGADEIFEAVNDISTKDSQAEILKSLVSHAGKFAPRGVFFIVKNEHLGGWRAVGSDDEEFSEKVREISLPVSAAGSLGKAVSSLQTVTSSAGEFAEDADFLNRLGYGEPREMIAVPLVARGRGVAVLYADGGAEDALINKSALETLTRVAGLTVEVLAGAKAAKKETAKQPAAASSAFAPAFSEPAVSEVYTAETFADDKKFADEYLPQDEQPAEIKAEEKIAAEETVPSYQFDENVTYIPPVEESFKTQETLGSSTAGSNFGEPYNEQSFVTPVAPATPPFFDPAPSLAPSVVEEEPVAEEIPASFRDYADEEPQAAFDDFKQPDSEEVKYGEIVYQDDDFGKVKTVEPEAAYPAFENAQVAESEPAEQFSAEDYAANFAKTTDPSDYAKDFSYQSEEVQTAPEIVSPTVSVEADDYSVNPEISEIRNDFETSPTDTFETKTAESFQGNSESFQSNIESFTPTKEQTYTSFDHPAETAPPVAEASFEPAAESVSQGRKTRLSERNVDLPIEVSDGERRLHNDARRFARLLVSEIKLYNEQKVREGREANDLYDRLREAIDRSREMYDKRVQPAVASKFDYFHYELLNTLAEGAEAKLGADYPGSTLS